MIEGLCFYSSKYRVTKGFKFHAQPQTGAYSCHNCSSSFLATSVNPNLAVLGIVKFLVGVAPHITHT